MYLTLAGLFHARWTDAIHDEWMRHVLDNHPDLDRAKVERVRDLMNLHVLDCLITGYEHLIPSLSLPDPDDRHVLAAAIHGGANLIVTMNLRDFPRATLSKYEIEAKHPDRFICELLEQSPEQVCDAAKRQRQSLKNPPKNVEEFLATLRAAGLRKTAAQLSGFRDSL